ncbi:hypothetical protein [Massilia glaciei]|uniref:hypothetical protein n=1 Tax=Massilia glaciei TaxID=1524097 RepID=UPI0015E80D84|nr:hypothetical protein [Massilia glaciei]
MSALMALRKIAAGERPHGELLPPCRLEAFGVEVYGEEAIVQSFRNAPLAIPASAQVVAADGHIAVFEGEHALFADLHGEDIARVWRLGPGQPATAEPAIGVPFDPDLWQARRDAALRREDHPALSEAGVAAVEEIGLDLARQWESDGGPGDYRVRPFLLRAFSAGERGAALYAVYRLGPSARRSAGFSLVAANFEVSGGRLSGYAVVRDQAGEAAVQRAPWQPRVAA